MQTRYTKIVAAIVLAAGLSGCAQIEAAQRGARSVFDAGPEVAAAEARVIAMCTAGQAEIEAAIAGLEAAYRAQGISQPSERARDLAAARCGRGALGVPEG